MSARLFLLAALVASVVVARRVTKDGDAPAKASGASAAVPAEGKCYEKNVQPSQSAIKTLKSNPIMWCKCNLKGHDVGENCEDPGGGRNTKCYKEADGGCNQKTPNMALVTAEVDGCQCEQTELSKLCPIDVAKGISTQIAALKQAREDARAHLETAKKRLSKTLKGRTFSKSVEETLKPWTFWPSFVWWKFRHEEFVTWKWKKSQKKYNDIIDHYAAKCEAEFDDFKKSAQSGWIKDNSWLMPTGVPEGTTTPWAASEKGVVTNTGGLYACIGEKNSAPFEGAKPSVAGDSQAIQDALDAAQDVHDKSVVCAGEIKALEITKSQTAKLELTAKHRSLKLQKYALFWDTIPGDCTDNLRTVFKFDADKTKEENKKAAEVIFPKKGCKDETFCKQAKEPADKDACCECGIDRLETCKVEAYPVQGEISAWNFATCVSKSAGTKPAEPKAELKKGH